MLTSGSSVSLTVHRYIVTITYSSNASGILLCHPHVLCSMCGIKRMSQIISGFYKSEPYITRHFQSAISFGDAKSKLQDSCLSALSDHPPFVDQQSFKSSIN